MLEPRLSFLPRITYGVNSSRNPVFLGSLNSLDSRLHGNDTYFQTVNGGLKQYSIVPVFHYSRWVLCPP
jgi:hypothetical protein